MQSLSKGLLIRPDFRGRLHNMLVRLKTHFLTNALAYSEFGLMRKLTQIGKVIYRQGEMMSMDN